MYHNFFHTTAGAALAVIATVSGGRDRKVACVGDIERREGLSYEEFSTQYLYPNKPVIVKGALSKWKAINRWTPEFFKTEFGDVTFSVNDSEKGQGEYKSDGGTQYNLAEFIDLVLASTDEHPAPYFRNQLLYELFPTLKDDIQPLPEYVHPNWLSDRYAVKRVAEILNRGAAIELYIGGKGSSFPVLHYDGAGTHAFLMQIHGRKQYIVYSPDQDPFMYASPDKPNVSRVNSLDCPDLERFPLFAKATPITFFLDPGELLFVPSHWWHTAKILSPSITVSINVLNQSNWHELEKYVSLRQRNPLMAMAGQVYLAMAGAKRSFRDRIWHRNGGH